MPGYRTLGSYVIFESGKKTCTEVLNNHGKCGILMKEQYGILGNAVLRKEDACDLHTHAQNDSRCRNGA